MNDRREFLKHGLLVAAGAALAGPAKVAASMAAFPAGVIYTAEKPGRWAEKAGGHVPKVAVDGRKVTITTPHPMTEKHFIVRHTLVASDGTVLGEKTFVPTDEKAVSSYEIPADRQGALYATSFCNIHDFWLTEFSI